MSKPRTKKFGGLELRGAVVLLHRAIVSIGKNQLTNDWDGTYRNSDVEETDKILRKACWHVEADFEKANR